MRMLVFGEWWLFGSVLMHGPEHGGQDVKGGGHPSGEKLTEEEEIDIGLDRPIMGHAKTPGIDDPGVPGSRTNPVRKHPTKEEEEEESGGPEG